MSNLLVFCFSLLIFHSSYCFDSTTFNYCKLKYSGCVEGADPDHGGHAACNCTPMASRADYQDKGNELLVFRREILHLHNKYRNMIASGEESRVPQASNMMVLNYDLELEHIAKCRALNSYGKVQPVKQETCSYTAEGEPYGQNSYVDNPKEEDKQDNIQSRGLLPSLNSLVPSWVPHILIEWPGRTRSCAKSWYNQIGGVSSRAIERFPEEKQPAFGNFMQMVSATTTHLGCVRVWSRDLSDAPWQLLFLCDYKGAGDVANRLVYKQGKGCSNCPSGTKCETKEYPFLCGKLKKVETGFLDEVPDKEPKKSEGYVVKNWVLITTCSFFVVFMFSM